MQSGSSLKCWKPCQGNLYRRSFGQRKQHVIGKHVRHIIDHYSAPAVGNNVTGSAARLRNRNRDLSLETDRRAGANRLSEILRTLRSRFSGNHAKELAMLHTSDEQGR